MSCPPALLAVLFLSTPLAAQIQTHGDMVGSVTSDSAVFWTRASGAALVSVLHGTDAGLVGATETPPVAVGAVDDFTARIAVGSLLPNTPYYFATVVAHPSIPGLRQVGSTGAFRTAPLETQAISVDFAVAADIRDMSQYANFTAMGAHSPTFLLCLGDFPYADASPAATSLGEYWAKHKEVRNSVLLQDFFRRTPIVATWDDHEVKNNWDAATNATNVTNGIAAWFDYFPLPPGATDIYHSVRWGALLEVFVLDTRRYRAVNNDPVVPGKPMLGAAQKAWLKTGLQASTADFKVIATSVPLRYGTTGKDHWEGFMHERRELFDWILDQNIHGVVFLSGDQHWSAVHHHREGFREFQACPLATSTRAPEAIPDPEVRFIGVEDSYGIVRVRGGAIPSLTVEIHGSNGLLRTETILAQEPARLRITADVPEGRFELEGPQYFRNEGKEVTLPRVEAGSTELRFGAVPGLVEIPADLPMVVPPGAEVTVATSYRDLPSASHPVLFESNFEEHPIGLTVVDQGNIDAPSSWFVDNGYLYQTGNIYGGSTAGSVADKPGTMAILGDPAWGDITLSTRVRSEDNDGIGVVFRYQNPHNYYRFSMDSQRGYRRLSRTVAGTTTSLAEDAVAYDVWRWYELQVVVSGAQIDVLLDGVSILSASDATFPAGRVGLYTWGNSLTSYENLIVRSGDASSVLNNTLFEDDFQNGVLSGWTIEDQGTTSAPSSWSESGGSLHQTSNIYGGSMSAALVPKPGTIASAGALWTDFVFDARMRNSDDDGIGVVFRYLDPNHHYRFSMDSQRGFRRLAKVVGGSWTVLFEDTVSYSLDTWMHVRCSVDGARIQVFLEGALWAEVIDPSLLIGKIGLYCWGSDGADFDDVRVTASPQRRAVFAGIEDGLGIDLIGRAPRQPGRIYTLALSGGDSPGIPLDLLAAGDPRILYLNPDPLFFLSLSPSPIFISFIGVVGAEGEIQARLALPPIPGLSGIPLYAGGWILGTQQFHMAELLPTLALAFP